ncbi:conserved hypothetical protein [Methanocaldococcus vulcanius M7]|uniref:Lysylphosphatidylglycerol synthetase/UPF0104 n=1 Tax=Methanocaldococcus vulcanius (strain ATCC 700851 / DSM 12094 / M7) TaxID=579137 RepID=C9RGW3_METVM|nr:UPF0104 family protein [Methanocaldococcus vulcanius]ACX72815.1 conserved hypothetical protein [Methanocaldococcus vulcanius M7]
MKVKITKSTILLLISFLFILAIMSYIGLDKIINALINAKPKYIILAIILQIIVSLILSARWRFIIKILGYSANFKNIFLLVLMGLFINNITPSMRGGGEAFRAYYLSKIEKIPKGLAFSTVVVERVLDTSIFLFFTLFVIGYFVFTGFEYLKYLILSWLFLFFITAVVVYLIANKTLLIKTVTKISKIICKYSSYKYDETKILQSIEEFYNSMKFFKNKRGWDVIIAIFLSVLWYIVDILKLWILFLSLSYAVSIICVSAVYLITLLSGVLSITPSGFGTADTIMIVSFSAFNIPPSVAAAITLLDRLISYIFPTIIGYIAMLIIKKKLNDLTT